MPNFLSIDRRPEGYAILTLAGEPVNTLNLDAWHALSSALSGLEADPKVHGVIFCSGLQRDVFSAGNDIMELYAPKTSEQRYTDFWTTSNRFLARLYRTRLLTIAALRGAVPAGGCCLALCCDMRIMTDFGNIGLNEVVLGISVPKYWALLMARTIGTAPAERILQFGRMLNVQEAKGLGLVDEVVSKPELLHKAEARMKSLLKLPPGARSTTKANLRLDFSREWEAFCEPEAHGAWKMLESPAVVKSLERYMQQLAAKSQQKAKL